MNIQANSRQIPSVISYTSDNKYNDLLYSVLQQKSYHEVINGVSTRYVDKKDVVFSKLCHLVDLSRQKTSQKFNNLIEKGLVQEDPNPKMKRYILNELDTTVASLVPLETLRKINNALSQHAISLFVYLMNRYIANGEKQFIATMNQMKDFIGVATGTTSNNNIITDILEILKLIGLVEWRYQWDENNKKTLIVIEGVRNQVKKMC